jgi:hypothetical protein
VFGSRVLRKIFAPKRDEVTEGWRKPHDLYSSQSIIRTTNSRRMMWAEHVTRMGEKRNVYRLLVGKPEGKSPLGRPRRRLIDNIKVGHLVTGLGGVDWTGLA